MDQFGPAALGPSMPEAHSFGGPPVAGPGLGSDMPPDLIAPPAPVPATGPLDPAEAEFQAIYQDFVDTRQRCGESTDGLTFDKFAQRLRTNRDQLLSRYDRMDFADASLVLLAEKTGIREVLTVDRRDFSVYRLHGKARPTLLP